MRGTDKLLEIVDGEALLRRITLAATRSGAPVMVALPPDRPARRAAIAGLGVTVVQVENAASGMATSIRAGLQMAVGAAGLMILPADMPELDASDIARLIEAFDQQPQQIWRAASADGRPGHPVIFPAALFADLARISGDTGARQLVFSNAELVSLLALPAMHALTDLDTPEAWAAWRAANPRR